MLYYIILYYIFNIHKILYATKLEWSGKKLPNAVALDSGPVDVTWTTILLPLLFKKCSDTNKCWTGLTSFFAICFDTMGEKETNQQAVKNLQCPYVEEASINWLLGVNKDLV